MSVRRMKVERLSRGFKAANGRRQVCVHIDEDTFGQLRQRAIEQGDSVSEQVRTLIEWGLERAEWSTIGVGNGRGNLFVHGSHEAVRRVRDYILSCEQLVRERKRA